MSQQTMAQQTITTASSAVRGRGLAAGWERTLIRTLINLLLDFWRCARPNTGLVLSLGVGIQRFELTLEQCRCRANIGLHCRRT